MVRDRDQGPVLTDRRSHYEVMHDVLLGAKLHPIVPGQPVHPERRRLLRSGLPDQALGYQPYALAVVRVGGGQSFLQLVALEPRIDRMSPSEVLAALNDTLDQTVGQGFQVVRQGTIQYEDDTDFPRAVEVAPPIESIHGTTDAMFEIFETHHRRDFHPYHE